MKKHLRDEVAMNLLFGKNVQSMLKLGRAQGVAMAAVLTKDLPISEYSPENKNKFWKWSSQRASGCYVKKHFKIKNTTKIIRRNRWNGNCSLSLFSKNLSSGDKNYSGWKGFIKDNPNRTSH